MWKEFKEFAMRGNAIDMAIGIIIGGAFGKIVSSLVNDIIMPPIGMLLGGMDFSNLMITLHQQTIDSPAVTIKYGMFINTVIDFIIVAFAIFIVMKQANKLSRSQTKVDPTQKACPYCCSEIAIKASRCPDCTSQLTP